MNVIFPCCRWVNIGWITLGSTWQALWLHIEQFINWKVIELSWQVDDMFCFYQPVFPLNYFDLVTIPT